MESRLRQHRKRLGLSVLDVSQRAGIKAQTYYKYEEGSRFPRRAVLIRLAAVLGLPVETFFQEGGIRDGGREN